MKLRPLVVLLALFAALALAACGESRQWQGTIEERDGVMYVSNPREGLWQGREPPPIRFELEQVFGVDTEPEEEILGFIGVHAVAVDGDGNVYVYDQQANQLCSFAPNGTLRWKAGREGQGPGEFSNAQGIAWDGVSSIYVTNANGQRLDRWSTDAVFLGSDPLSGQGLPTGTLIGFLDPTNAVLEGNGTSSVGGEIVVIDLTTPWTSVARVNVDVADDDVGPNGAWVSMVASGGFVTVGDVDSYDLRLFNREGELTIVISRDFEKMVGFPDTTELARGYSRIYSWLYPAFRLPNGYWLATAGWIDVADPAADYARRRADNDFDEMPWRSSIDVFDPDGRFLYSLADDGMTSPIGDIEAIGLDGKLYTSVRDPFPQVRRYRVEIDEQ